MDLFHFLVACHIVTGAIGLVAFWVPVASKKGGSLHMRVGRVFTICMLATGMIAIGISTTTLLSPLETHPAFTDAALVRGIFGWMMLYLALLTINLAWHGWRSAINKRFHDRNWEWRNLLLQSACSGGRLELSDSRLSDRTGLDDGHIVCRLCHRRHQYVVSDEEASRTEGLAARAHQGTGWGRYLRLHSIFGVWRRSFDA